MQHREVGEANAGYHGHRAPSPYEETARPGSVQERGASPRRPHAVPAVDTGQPRRRPSAARGSREAPKRTSASDQQRASERLTKGRAGEHRNMALMRRLNESASFLSDVSNLSEDDDRGEPQEEPPQENLAQLYGDGKCLYLAEMLNESATWIDCDISESDREEIEQPPPEVAPVHHVAGRAAVARSFSY